MAIAAVLGRARPVALARRSMAAGLTGQLSPIGRAASALRWSPAGLTPASAQPRSWLSDDAAAGMEEESLVQVISSSREFHACLEDNKRCIVYFTATWCGPCRFIAPEFEKLAKEFGHAVAFLKVDIDEMSRLASKHSINAVPTFLCFIGGEQLPGELVGADMAGLRAAAEQLAASAEGESDSD